MKQKLWVRGEALGSAELPGEVQGTLFLRIEDVSRADAAGVVVAQLALPNIRLGANHSVPFEIPVAGHLIDSKRTYCVQGHLSPLKDQEIHQGDLLTMSSYPVLTQGFGTQVQIHLRMV